VVQQGYIIGQKSFDSVSFRYQITMNMIDIVTQSASPFHVRGTDIKESHLDMTPNVYSAIGAICRFSQ
jgi:hypothetical protein